MTSSASLGKEGATMDHLRQYIAQPAFARFWQAVKAKYEQLGRLGGYVSLSQLTEDERDALSGLLALNLYGQSELKVRLSAVDAALQSSRFQTGVVDCLRLLFPDSLQTREEQRQLDAIEWESFCRWATSCAQTDKVRVWILQVIEQRASGYRVFLDCFEEFRQVGVSPAWVAAVRSLEHLPQKAVRLPVFAAELTGNPHGLDRDTLAGKVFYHGISAMFTNGLDAALLPEAIDTETAAPVELSRAVYERAGILLDDISSIVWVGHWQGLYDEAVALPLWSLSQKASLPAARAVFVVENPSVFAVLMESRGQLPVVCTSGQPSLAALRLLDLAANQGARIYYNGDFDVKGLQMLTSLRQRYGSSLIPWLMDSDTYLSVQRDDLPQFTDAERGAIAHMPTDWDVRLTDTMCNRGVKVFQEQILQRLVEHYERASGACS